MSSPDSRTDKLLYPTTVAALSIAVLFALTLLPRWFPSGSSALIGQPAPEFTLDVLHNGDPGSRLRLSDLRGHTVVLDFWASWCDACKVGAPILDRVARRHKDDGLVVVGISTNDDVRMALGFARRTQLSYPILFDERDSTAARYHVQGLPTLVVINANGDVVAVRTGVESESELERLVAQAR